MPEPLAALRVRVTNPEVDPNHATYDSQLLSLCATADAKNCNSLPLSVTLRPGENVGVLTRVEVIALDASGKEIVHDATQFRFTDGLTQDLDFHLSLACLNTYCAAQNEVCGPNGGCVPPAFGTGNSSTDGGGIEAPGKIERWYQESHMRTEGSVFLSEIPIPKPASARVGDLLVVSSAFPMRAVGWTEAMVTDAGSVLYRRVAQGDPDGYPIVWFHADEQDYYLMASYRGVTQVIVGSALTPTSDGSFPMLSMEVPRTGSWLTTWIGRANYGGCTRGGVAATFSSPRGDLEELPDLTIGPSGSHLYTCDPPLAAPKFAVQLLLVP